MSIDANAGERQEAVRGRVKEKPEIEIDPALPMTPSKFPLAPAIALAVLVTAAIPVAVYISRRDGLTDEQRANVHATESKQRAFMELYASMRSAHDQPACAKLLEVVTKPCLPGVDVSLLEFDRAAYALGSISPSACSIAAAEFSTSRIDAQCDRAAPDP